MGIDSIGKKGPPAPPPPTTGKGVEGASRASRPFEAPATATSGAEGAAKAGSVEAPRTALERLRAGEIDVNGYVDIKVHEATTHLSALPPAELEQIRSSLRDRMAGDPTLVDLVRTATGSVPQPSTDD
jgi:uncharacterized protein (DUF2342 family)